MNICWVIERNFQPVDAPSADIRYFTWAENWWNEDGTVNPDPWWDSAWERAVKLFDRESCEMICADMPFEWQVNIKEHQVG